MVVCCTDSVICPWYRGNFFHCTLAWTHARNCFPNQKTKHIFSQNFFSPWLAQFPGLPSEPQLPSSLHPTFSRWQGIGFTESSVTEAAISPAIVHLQFLRWFWIKRLDPHPERILGNGYGSFQPSLFQQLGCTSFWWCTSRKTAFCSMGEVGSRLSYWCDDLCLADRATNSILHHLPTSLHR